MTSEQQDNSVVWCEGLTKKYDEITALDHLDLSIPRGAIFGYIGHNGAGKTTTIRILAGLLKPSGGRASICGVDVVKHRDKIKSLLGYMPDSFGVYDQMRVWEYLDFFGAAFKIPRRKRRERLDYVLDITDAEYMRDRFVDTLSKGMKQRVGIARTLMHDPEVLLLDEPANGLDPHARIQMRQLLRKLADGGKTLLVSSHILPELAAICDYIGIIHQGVLRACGPIESVLRDLRRDRLMEIKCLANPDAARENIQADPHSRKVETSELEKDVLRFRFTGDDEALADLLQAVNAAGARTAILREVPLSLEDAYMAVSGIDDGEHENQDESPAPTNEKTTTDQEPA
ncbi:MAG: ABC transporter ATP-binding protein [Phycisphaerae bacterium]|nr:ABC transporter ATP-binding protein [Phycisphaerae bacterium]